MTDVSGTISSICPQACRITLVFNRLANRHAVHRQFRSRLSTIHVTSLCLFALFLAADVAGPTSPQQDALPEQLHGVISRRQLAPALRSAKASLIYSHDGRYLLLQDSAGVYLISRDPLKIFGQIAAPNSYAARFSADSHSVILVSLALSYERWSVQDGKLLDSKTLPIPDGCVDAQLSPDGSLFACYRPDFSLGVLQLSSGAWIFSDRIYVPDSHVGIIPIPLDLDVPFAGAFGFALAHDMNLLANRGVSALPMAFSPDGSTLIAGDPRGAVRVDTIARKTVHLPAAIQKMLGGSVAIKDKTRALVIPFGKPGAPGVRRLADGGILSTLNFKADSARLATASRYALLQDFGAPGARVFDLEENRPVETPKNIAVDVYGDELALATQDGELALFRNGEQSSFSSVSLPDEGFPALRGVAVTPGLEKIAIAADGEAALFEIATGRRISNLPQFSSCNFADSSSAFLLNAERRPEPAWELEYLIDRVDAQGLVHASPISMEVTRATVPQTVWRLDLTEAKASPVWSGGESVLRAGGPVLFEYAFESLAGRGLFLPRPDSTSSMRGARLPVGIGPPFRLRALDPANGRELWNRTFGGLPPVPFADPQGERVVLSWQAASVGASAAARHDTAARNALRKAKLTDQDSFLEVLDARTGKSLGGVLVQSGTGPANFDSLFSVGQSIVFSRDVVRVQIYSLQDGQLRGKLIGIRPSANAQSNLLALDLGSGRLAIYDLNTAVKLDEQVFPEPILYTHFSADGQRLLVLTEKQDAFVLQMKGLRRRSAYCQLPVTRRGR